MWSVLPMSGQRSPKVQNGQTFGIWSDDPFRANQSKRVKSVDTDQTAPFGANQINPTEPAHDGPSWTERFEADKGRFWAVVAELGQG